MKITHHVRKENSGLLHSTLEIAEEEERQGHDISIIEPSTGDVLYGFNGAMKPDMHCIHSQLHAGAYHDKVPKLLWMHGEPLGSVGNGVSMRAIVDLAPTCEAFICMRKEEQVIWDSIKHTHTVTKGIDLNRFKVIDPLPAGVEKLSGEPAVLYYENWRAQRNPLLVCVAMLEIIKEFPKAKLHLYNCPGGKMYDTFRALINHSRWHTFIGSLKGQEKDVVTLLNRADIVVSGLHPLYARGIEAFGCGRAFIGPGYREHDDYPYQCDLTAPSIATAIRKCWLDMKDSDAFNRLYFRHWAEKHHNIGDTVKQSVAVYEKYAR